MIAEIDILSYYCNIIRFYLQSVTLKQPFIFIQAA